MSAFGEICKDTVAFVADVATMPLRAPAKIYHECREGGQNPVQAALASAGIELLKASPGAIGFAAGPEAGLIFMGASSLLMTMTFGAIEQFDDEKLKPCGLAHKSRVETALSSARFNCREDRLKQVAVCGVRQK